MRTRTLGVTLLVASMAAFGPASLAQGDDVHPARIQSGTCGGGGATVAALADVSRAFLVDGVASAAQLPVGVGSAVPLAASVTTVPLAIADLVGTGHSIAIAHSATDPTMIACGDIGGRTMGDGDLPFGLAAVGDSSSTGVASLHDGGDSTTTVTVYLLSSAAPATSPVPSAGPTSTTVTPGASLYYAGFDIVVEDITHDQAAGTVTVNATFHNTATAPNDLINLTGGQIWLSWDQSTIDLTTSGATVPANTTVPGTFTGGVPPEFVMADAVLTFGKPGNHQATLPLVEGSVATFEAPVVLDVSKKVKAKKYATFQVTDVEVVPALCNGNIAGFVFLPAPVNEASIVVTTTVSGGTGIGVGGLGLGGSFARGPDGLSGAGVLGTPVLGVRQVLRDVTYCFPVTAPVHGKHAITFLVDPVKASMSFEVP